MNIRALMNPRVFAPEDGTGTPPADGAPADTTAPPPDAQDTGGQPPPDGAPAPKWWEVDKFNEDARTALKANGLTVDDPLDAVSRLLEMERAAQKKLGNKPDQLIAKPKDGQSVADWLAENRGTFGLPDTAEAYEVKKPEGWPDGAPWDQSLESETRKLAHKHGLTGDALNEFVGLYATKVQGLLSSAETALADANKAMMSDLQNDWGDQTQARMTMAGQAARAVAEAAGIDNTGLQALSAQLSAKTGDAAVIRMFAKIGEMMGEDKFAGNGGGSTGLGGTPAEARQQLARLRAPDGDYGKAFAAGDRRRMAELQPEIDRLTRLAVE